MIGSFLQTLAYIQKDAYTNKKNRIKIKIIFDILFNFSITITLYFIIRIFKKNITFAKIKIYDIITIGIGGFMSKIKINYIINEYKRTELINKEIEVNDNGETIVVNVEDQNFIDRFYGLIGRLDEITKEMDSEAVKGLEERMQVRKMIERTKELMTDIDGMFGAECCRKVFGDIVPSPYIIADFFEKLTPIAEEYMDERQKTISKKYNNNRKGARTNKYRTKEEIIQDAMR